MKTEALQAYVKQYEENFIDEMDRIKAQEMNGVFPDDDRLIIQLSLRPLKSKNGIMNMQPFRLLQIQHGAIIIQDELNRLAAEMYLYFNYLPYAEQRAEVIDYLVRVKDHLIPFETPGEKANSLNLINMNGQPIAEA